MCVCVCVCLAGIGQQLPALQGRRETESPSALPLSAQKRDLVLEAGAAALPTKRPCTDTTDLAQVDQAGAAQMVGNSHGAATPQDAGGTSPENTQQDDAPLHAVATATPLATSATATATAALDGQARDATGSSQSGHAVQQLGSAQPLQPQAPAGWGQPVQFAGPLMQPSQGIGAAAACTGLPAAMWGVQLAAAAQPHAQPAAAWGVQSQWGATAQPPATASAQLARLQTGWGIGLAPRATVAPGTTPVGVQGVFSGAAFAAAATDAARSAVVHAGLWLPAQSVGATAPAAAAMLASALRGSDQDVSADQRRVWMLSTLSDTIARFGASTAAQSGSAAEVIRSASARIAALQTQVTGHTLHTDTARALDFCVGALTRALLGGAPAANMRASELATTFQLMLQVVCQSTSQ